MQVQQSTLRAQNVPVVLEWKRRHPCWALREEHPIATKGGQRGVSLEKWYRKEAERDKWSEYLMHYLEILSQKETKPSLRLRPPEFTK